MPREHAASRPGARHEAAANLTEPPLGHTDLGYGQGPDRPTITIFGKLGDYFGFQKQWHDVELAPQECGHVVAVFARSADGPEASWSVDPGELFVLVVDECAHREQEDRSPALQGCLEGDELADHGLAGRSRRRDDEVVAVQHAVVVDSTELEIVELSASSLPTRASLRG